MADARACSEQMRQTINKIISGVELYKARKIGSRTRLTRGYAAAVTTTVRENVCNNSKNVKSHVFWILKKNVKNVKKRTYSFTGHLITQPLILNYQKSVPVSHQHQTSFSEIRTQETMQLRNVCDKRL